MNTLLQIDPAVETKKITTFLQKTFQEQGIHDVVLGLSGGIDSATSLFLLTRVFPKEHIHVVHMPYFEKPITPIEDIIKAADLPKEQLSLISIKESVDAFKNTLALKETDTIRIGNVMARSRMIMLFDMAKKHSALVCGTENKSEYHLAYFTRFGDEASDIEPIKHLYKTQIFSLAQYLGVPQFVLDAKPTAGLWDGQTDEDEFGFSYSEADMVFARYFDKKESLKTIEKDIPHAANILAWTQKNDFKHHVPYTL